MGLYKDTRQAIQEAPRQAINIAVMALIVSSVALLAGVIAIGVAVGKMRGEE